MGRREPSIDLCGTTLLITLKAENAPLMNTVYCRSGGSGNNCETNSKCILARHNFHVSQSSNHGNWYRMLF